MDSVTQALLGAAVGEATLGRHVGHKAPLWGAMLGTLPDLDVLYPFADPVSAFTWHRGPSHSIFVLAALTPLVVWLPGGHLASQPAQEPAYPILREGVPHLRARRWAVGRAEALRISALTSRIR
jgi:hypothetical protein